MSPGAPPSATCARLITSWQAYPVVFFPEALSEADEERGFEEHLRSQLHALRKEHDESWKWERDVKLELSLKRNRLWREPPPLPSWRVVDEWERMPMAQRAAMVPYTDGSAAWVTATGLGLLGAAGYGMRRRADRLTVTTLDV